MVPALQHQAERCSVELRSRKPSDTLVPGGMDSPPTPMYVVHSLSEPFTRCIGVEVIGTTSRLQTRLSSVDAHHSTCVFDACSRHRWGQRCGFVPGRFVCRLGVREGALCPGLEPHLHTT
eukprot:scaffold33957_cov91-Phaeocystis_antarctica.AAC.1